MLSVSELFIYPIKSLGGISVRSAMVTSRGFQYDRRWMLVDEHNQFLTQRVYPKMALLQVELFNGALKVHHKINGDALNIPITPETDETAIVQIWDDKCDAQFVGDTTGEWFSDMLSVKCRLVFMPDTSKRLVDKNYAINNELNGFSDDFQFLMIGQASLTELNSRLAQPVPINRFRPNIVFTGGEPFEEDEIKEFTINKINFYSAKPCSRCMVTTINQDDGSKTNEPLKTLSKYRTMGNKVYFGQYLLMNGEGEVQIGDTLNI